MFIIKGVAKGGGGARDTLFFNQTTYKRWRKCHDDILAIVTIW